MAAKSGVNSVQASEDVQMLHQAATSSQMHPGESRLEFKGSNGESLNLTQQIRYVQGRAVYHTGTFWVDAKLQSINGGIPIRIRFNSPEYYDLLGTVSETAEFLALGRNVRFVSGNRIYEIYE